MKKPDLVKFQAVLSMKGGNISEAAEHLEVSRQAVYDWIKADEEFKKVHEDVNEATIDLVEGKLIQAIEAGNVQAMIFFLKTRARHRGYSEKSELTIMQEQPLFGD